MPLYDDDDVVSEVVTDFGKGRSLSIHLKDDATSIPIARRLFNLYRQTESVQRRIASLQAEQAKAGPEKFAEIQAQITEWEALPDNFNLAVDLLHAVGCGWDYYPSKQAEAEGQPYEFTKEQIAKIKPMHLMKVIENVNRALGLVEDVEEAKKSDSSLSEPSSQTDIVSDGLSPNGTVNSTMTAL